MYMYFPISTLKTLELSTSLVTIGGHVWTSDELDETNATTRTTWNTTGQVMMSENPENPKNVQ